MDDAAITKFLVKAGVGAILVILFLIFVNPIVLIGPGERGVVMTLGKVQPYVMGEGLNFRTPFIQSVKTMSVRVQKSDVKAGAASKDLQDVQMELVVNWHVDPAKVNNVYQSVGDESDILEKIINPAVSEVAKASSALKNAEEIITKRPELKQDIDTRLQSRLTSYGVTLDDVSLTNVEFSKDFNAAIEAKQVAEQDAKRAVFVAQKAEQEAAAKVNLAKGEAEAQRLQQQTLTPELLQKLAIEKWKGDVPTYWGGSALPFLQIPKAQ